MTVIQKQVEIQVQFENQLLIQMNTSVSANVRYWRYLEKLNARRANAEENPSSVYTSYVRQSSHDLFKTLVEDNPFGFACTVCDRLWFKNDLKSPPLSCWEILQ